MYNLSSLDWKNNFSSYGVTVSYSRSEADRMRGVAKHLDKGTSDALINLVSVSDSCRFRQIPVSSKFYGSDIFTNRDRGGSNEGRIFRILKDTTKSPPEP